MNDSGGQVAFGGSQGEIRRKTTIHGLFRDILRVSEQSDGKWATASEFILQCAKGFIQCFDHEVEGPIARCEMNRDIVGVDDECGGSGEACRGREPGL